MGAGRPPKYSKAEDLEAKIQEYFDKVVKSGDHITISGLVLHCGFSDRASFYDYEKKPEFTHTIKRARTLIEEDYEKYLRTGNATGAIFALKNFGWTDKREIDQTVKGEFKGIDINIIQNGESES